MSEASTQKLLVTMICAFAVVMVLVGYGKQRAQRLERLTPETSPTVAARPALPITNHDQANAIHRVPSKTNQPPAQWQSSPKTATTPSNTNFAPPRELPARDSFYRQQSSVQNHLSPSAALASREPSRAIARSPSAQKLDQRSYQSQQQTNSAPLQPAKQNGQQTRPSIQIHDFGNVEQAVATQPISKQTSSVEQAVAESPIPERDMFTDKEHLARDTIPQPTTPPRRGQVNNPFFQPETAKHSVLTSPLPEQIPQAVQSSIGTKVPTSEAPARMDRRVRKANWTEIEAAPRVDLTTNFRPLQQPTLPRRSVNSQVESAAREKILYGQSLGRRRAHFAARDEFIQALLLIANSYNAESNSTAHPERLAQGLVAIDELSDFTTATGLMLQQKIFSHKSHLLAPQDIATTSPMQAMGLYSDFAQSQIVQAIGSSAAGSEALHALGKLETMVSEAERNQIKALVFYRAAIEIDPSNIVCANDLGVLLFNMGRLQESENALTSALRSTQSELTWNNLASVHRQRAANANSEEQRKRQLSLANLAAQRATKFAMQSSNDQPSNGGLNRNQWATPNEFQNNAAFPNVVVQHANSGSPENTLKPNVGKSATLLQKMKDWF